VYHIRQTFIINTPTDRPTHCSLRIHVRSIQPCRVRQIKVIPCRVLLISQQRIGIVKRKFTVLFLIHIYV